MHVFGIILKVLVSSNKERTKHKASPFGERMFYDSNESRVNESGIKK